MKALFTTLRLTFAFVFLAASVMFLYSCNDDEKPKVIPEVTTAAVTNFTTTTATAGGEIVSDGNAAITASGVVYSSTNNPPALTDSKTEEDATEGSFTTELESLTSGTQYYVRAYATNSVGTGYGDVVTFSTGNAAPTAINISITGTVQVSQTLTATYTYSDSENDVESGTTIQWYRANDGAGTSETAIAGATTLTYTLQGVDEFKHIRIGITAKAATGTLNGTEIKSAFVGPVAEEPTTVTFPYNGASVTYGIIISPVTGRRWLDRNLGAPNAATAYNDFSNYGDLLQWGRSIDGHQLVNRAANDFGTTGTTGITTLSPTDNPGHSNFILVTTDPYDWRSTTNNNLWQGVTGINNPCPTGWRIPTFDEWQAEGVLDVVVGYQRLKLTFSGYRDCYDDAFYLTDNQGMYWSTTIAGDTWPRAVHVGVGGGFNSTQPRGNGLTCRCIKDN